VKGAKPLGLKNKYRCKKPAKDCAKAFRAINRFICIVAEPDSDKAGVAGVSPHSRNRSAIRLFL